MAATGSECGALIDSIDWSTTPIGPRDSWPVHLRAVLQLMLHSRHPMFLWWGPELVQFYNDAYMPSFGAGKHPAAMGQRGEDCWQEIWPIIGPQIEGVMKRGEPTWHEDALVPIFRNGRIEEVYWTYGYSPVVGERDTISGTLVVCTETTSRVISNRHQRLLNRVVESIGKASSPHDVVATWIAALAHAPEDLPFAAVLDPGGRCVHAVGIAENLVVGMPPIENPIVWTLPDALAVGPWPEPVQQAFCVPDRDGVVVFGLSSRLPFGDGYRDFLLQVAAVMRDARERSEAVAARADALMERSRLIEGLEEANRAKDEFLALLGHELRNPLAPIITALELIAARGPDPAEREHRIIGRQAVHMTRLVDDLIDVARIVRGKVELRREAVGLSSVIEKAIEIARPLIDRKRHQLDVRLPAADIRWWGDPVRLAQVIANLLTNSARYTEPGGVIALAVSAAADIRISVADNGHGISADFLPKVFDRFMQARTSGQSGGLGIGLTLVKSLVELHGGTVTATSAGPGCGSTFVVSLPIEPVPELAPPTPKPATSSTSKRILLVDDNVDAALLMADVLRGKGHVVEVAHDGPEALAMLASFTPDVALMDIGLPVMNGYDLAKRVIELFGRERLRLIALTGYGRERDREEAQQAGFHRHLVKPVKFGVLLEAIDEPSS